MHRHCVHQFIRNKNTVNRPEIGDVGYPTDFSRKAILKAASLFCPLGADRLNNGVGEFDSRVRRIFDRTKNIDGKLSVLGTLFDNAEIRWFAQRGVVIHRVLTEGTEQKKED